MWTYCGGLRWQRGERSICGRRQHYGGEEGGKSHDEKEEVTVAPLSFGLLVIVEAKIYLENS